MFDNIKMLANGLFHSRLIERIIEMAAKTSKKLTSEAAPKAAKATRAKVKTVANTTVKKSSKEQKAQCTCNETCADTKLTRVVAKFDAGWGNQLFIRGTGAGLDWQKGVAMQCVGDDEWLWEQLVTKGDVSFKILINDQTWSQGEDFVVASGDTIICHPTF